MEYLPYLFWPLVLLVLQPVSLRLSVVAFLLISHINMSGPGFDSAASVGWENAVKAIVLPAWLLLRSSWLLRREGQVSPVWVLRRLMSHWVAWLWIALVVYAIVGFLFSSYPLAAAKLIAALLSHTMLFLALVMAWLSGRLGPRTIWALVILTVALGVVQTYLVEGSPYANPFTQYRRFTTFAAPQSFVEGFVPFVAILVWSPRLNAFGQWTAMALLLTVLFANGSRIGFFGALLGVGLFFLRRLDLQRVLVALALVAFGSALHFSEWTRDKTASSRIAEVKSVVVDKQSDASKPAQSDAPKPAQSDASKPAEQRPRTELPGTLGFRQRLYSCYWSELRQKGSAEILFGSGTSSTGELAQSCKPRNKRMTFSVNRVTHNEFLRATWEWGLIGLAIVIGLVTSMIWIGLRGFFLAGRDNAPNWQFGPYVSALPLALLAIGFENILQAAGSPGPVGMTLVMALTAAASLRRSGDLDQDAGSQERNRLETEEG